MRRLAGNGMLSFIATFFVGIIRDCKDEEDCNKSAGKGWLSKLLLHFQKRFFFPHFQKVNLPMRCTKMVVHSRLPLVGYASSFCSADCDKINVM